LDLALGEKESIPQQLTAGEADDLHAAFEHHPATLRFGLGAFALPGRHRRDLEAQTNSGSEAADNELGQTPRGGLQNT
jgi:hypothetical protein